MSLFHMLISTIFHIRINKFEDASGNFKESIRRTFPSSSPITCDACPFPDAISPSRLGPISNSISFAPNARTERFFKFDYMFQSCPQPALFQRCNVILPPDAELFRC